MAKPASTNQPRGKRQNLVEAEDRITGKVTFKDYRNYWNYSLGCCGILIYIIVCALASIIQLGVTYQLTEWAKQPYEEQ